MDDFAKAVKVMRQHQKEYFKYRSYDCLEHARKAEKIVDQMLELKEPNLFS